MPLDEYRRKRDFTRTPEPSGDPSKRLGRSAWDALPHGHRYCVQMHRATRLHYDFRLEHNGVLLSWAVPRGPTLDPVKKRLAVQTEDHPIDYGDFEGVIPSGYGAGTVLLWDIGTFEWVKESAEDVERSLLKGDAKFRLSGAKLCGEFALVHIGARGRQYGGSGDETKNWLMIKKRDDAVVTGYEAIDHAVSVKTGRTMEQIAAEGGGDPREMARAARARAPRATAPAEAPPQVPALAPMLATAIDKPFSREGWLFELKYDGVRAIVTIDDGRVRIVGRHGRDETQRYPELQQIAASVSANHAVLDGEICVLDVDGRPSFEQLQSRINVSRELDIQRAVRECPVVFFAFDILELDARSLLATTLRIRKKTLRDVLRDSSVGRFADHVEADGTTFFEQVQRTRIEGLVAKRADSLYQPGRRSADWLKIKAWQTQSCVIAGYTAGQGKRREHLGALILAISHDGRLVHCGQVGTGFNDRTLRDLRARFEPLVVERPAVQPAPQTAEPATWLRPQLCCEVRHAGWTNAGILRHPAFAGLRDELTPDDCVREIAADTGALIAQKEAVMPAEGASPPSARADGSVLVDEDDIERALRELQTLRRNAHWTVGGRKLALTNLDKVFWPEDGLTKRDMIAYYVSMHRHLLPYLRDRPLSMQVFPDGIAGKSFWRKDKPSHAPAWMDSWTYHGEKTKEYIVVNEVATLAWVANAGVVDLHPWHSRIDAPDQPDWAVFDLDPFEPASFADVVDIAKLVKTALDYYHMEGVLKTSGQTGLQIYVPVRRGPGYDAVRAWVEEVGRAIGRIDPLQRITWEWTVAHRTGKIRIDYTQNIINKTLAAPYSLRPARGAPVSTPLAWEELDDPKLRSDGWTLRTIAARTAQVGDLFLPVLRSLQTLPTKGA